MNKNIEISDIFEKIADALEFKGENVFKIKAYRKASKIISELSEDIFDIWKNKRFGEIDGIGKSMAEKIEEFLSTGKIQKYQELMSQIPEGLLDLLKIQNIGTKTLLIFFDDNDISNRVRLICDYSEYSFIKADFDGRYKSTGKDNWEYDEGSETFSVIIEEKEWYFVVHIKKKLK